MTTHSTVRMPAVAGSFYPGYAEELNKAVELYLNDADANLAQTKPLAMIVPHAGYIYSGPIAASGYKQLIPYASEIERVVLMGPSHRVPFMGIATPTDDYFETPLGDIPIDFESISLLKNLSFVQELQAAHQQEHSLEVQLPFLQKIIPNFKLIPLVIGQANDQQVSDVIEQLWHVPNTLFVMSSDLSHYLNYESAQLSDKATCDAIEALQPQVIDYDQACGRAAIAGMLLTAKHHELQVKTLDLRNSGDTAGTKDRVVGYGCWVFY